MGRTSDSRQRLMDAAHELIWNYSYGAVTIEAICERAKVKKGSFYYFFDSKADLAVAAIEAWRDERIAAVRSILEANVAPLERITQYLDFVVHHQIAMYEECGRVLGCPIFTLGSEISTQDDRLLGLIQEICTAGVTYFETALRDAHAAGDIEDGPVVQKARMLWAYYEGTLTRARIENNPELLKHLCADVLDLVGARHALVTS